MKYDNKISVRKLSKKLKYNDSCIVIKQLLSCAIYARLLGPKELDKLENYYVEKSLTTQKVNHWLEKAIILDQIIKQLESDKVA